MMAGRDMEAEFKTIADRLLAEAPHVGDVAFRRLVMAASRSQSSELRGRSDLATLYRFPDGSELTLVENIHDPHPEDVPYLDDFSGYADYLAA